MAVVEHLRITDRPTNPGVAKFPGAFVHANGMLGLGGLSRPPPFNGILTKPRPTAWTTVYGWSTRRTPECLSQRPVSNGHGLDLVLHPSVDCRVGLSLNRSKPFRRNITRGAVGSHLTSDAQRCAETTADVLGRNTVELRLL